MTHIIPDNIPADQRGTAAALAAGAQSDRERTAVAMLLRLPGTALDLVSRHYTTTGDPDDSALHVAWYRLYAAAVDQQPGAIRPAERQIMLIACSIAASTPVQLGTMLPALYGHPDHARLLMDAVASAAGLDGYGRDEPVTGEPVPAGVDGIPVGTRCLRCGRALACPCGREVETPASLPQNHLVAVLLELGRADVPMTGMATTSAGHIEIHIPRAWTDASGREWPATALVWQPVLGWTMAGQAEDGTRSPTTLLVRDVDEDVDGLDDPAETAADVARRLYRPGWLPLPRLAAPGTEAGQ